MNNYTLAVYSFLDNYLKISLSKEDTRRKISDAEILTTVLLTARYFRGNYVSARLYMNDHQGMKKLDKSNNNI